MHVLIDLPSYRIDLQANVHGGKSLGTTATFI